MTGRLRLGLLFIMLLACTPQPSGETGTGNQEPGITSAVGPKSITVGALNPIRGFGPWLLGSTTGGAASYVEIHSNALANNDTQGRLEARLATRLPTFDDGSIAILPDGRMHTTWHLQPNVKWHDGAPLTAGDVVLGWQVAMDPEVPLNRSPALLQMERVEALDPLTVVISWKTTFYKALYLGQRDFWPLPSHLLAEHFAGDKTAFINLPYWTTEYVHVGPFRLTDYGLGESLVFERFDDYFLGRPKVNTITIRVISDPNALLSNLLAGAVDVATERTLSEDMMVRLRDEWNVNGEGRVFEREGSWIFMSVQFNPEWARPPELGREAAARRALLRAVDREAVREAILPGFESGNADSFMLKTDPRAPAVGRPFAAYGYDPAQANRELEQVGWRRESGGRLMAPNGDQVQVTLRATSGGASRVSIVAPYWRSLGIDVTEEIVPQSLANDNEYRAKFSGLEITSNTNGDAIFRRFDGRLHPGPQNRWAASNAGFYRNAGLDTLIDRLYATIDEQQQALALREMGEIMAADLPALPLYFEVLFGAVRKGVRALDDFAGTTQPGQISRGAHLWDRA